MTTKLFVLWLSLVRASSAAAATATTCGGDFSMAGAASVNRLAKTWLLGYRASCDGAMEISIDDSTSSTGAARVCGVRRDASPVDVATLTRPMNRLEAATVDEWRFDCERSTRSTLQVSDSMNLLHYVFIVFSFCLFSLVLVLSRLHIFDICID